ncbi:MAG TPA: hypothetical protein VFF53_13295 [Geobacteraceae bacterium]|nr:hypothetical protein [Geobacteraceae bacterium]
MSVRSTRYSPQLYLALLVLGMVGLIEWNYPYYFLKTDNLDQNLPYYVHNFRAVLAGEFPLFNFHQFLGTPVFACIQSAALYLPNYIAVALSKGILGHYYGTIDLLAALHLVVAAIGFFQLMRQWDLSPTSSIFGAVSWALCGFVMRVGDGWIQVIEYAAYFPWILLYGQRLANRFAMGPFVILTLLRTVALWMGNPPFFMYVVTFDLLCTGIWVGCDHGTAMGNGIRRFDLAGTVRPMMRHLASYGAAAVLSAPLLLPALHQIALSADRSSSLTWEQYSQGGYTLLLWLKGLLLPFSAEQYRLFGQQLFFAHIGWLTLIFALAASCCRPPQRRRAIGLLLLALLALFWADNTVITRLVYHLPFYNRQRFPFKLLFFTSFFAIALASLGYEHLLAAMRRKYRWAGVLGTVILVVHVANLLAFHLYTPYDTRRVKSVPYDEPLQESLSDGRIVTIVSRETDDQDKHPYLLGFNFATLFGLYHFAGYETLVSRQNLDAALQRNGSADFFVDGNRFAPLAADLQYFRRWGVRWYVLENKVKFSENVALRSVYRDGKRLVLYDEAANPPVFWVDTARDDGVTHGFTTNSIRITTERNTDGQLVVNVLHNPFFRAFIDNELALLTATADNQILVQVPAGRHRVRIVYRDPYFIAGLYLFGGFLVVITVWLYIATRRRNHAAIGR